MGQTHFKFHFLNWIFNFQGCFLCLLRYTEPQQGLIQFWPKTLNVLISGRGRKRWEDKSLVGKHESTQQQHWWHHILSSTLLHNISLLSLMVNESTQLQWWHHILCWRLLLYTLLAIVIHYQAWPSFYCVRRGGVHGWYLWKEPCTVMHSWCRGWTWHGTDGRLFLG